MAGLRDDVAARVMGELDAMTNTIDRITGRLDAQLEHLGMVEEKISAHVTALIEKSMNTAESPLNPETAAFLKREIHAIAVAGKNARAANLHAIESAVTETLRLNLSAIGERAGSILDDAAARSRTEIGLGVTAATDRANRTLNEICIDLNRKLQAMTSSTAKMQWAGMLVASVIAAVVATLITVHLVK